MSDPSGGRSGRLGTGGAGFSAARGAALVALAVIIGIVLLQAIDDGNDGPVGDGGASTTSPTNPSSSTDTSGGATSSTTAAASTPSTVPPAFVTVRVLNGSGVSGAAGQLTNTIKARGYKTLVAGDAAARQGNVVYFEPARRQDCATLAQQVPNDPKVQAVPTPVPGGEPANCIVVLGS
jgi:hypothetical protein